MMDERQMENDDSSHYPFSLARFRRWALALYAIFSHLYRDAHC